MRWRGLARALCALAIAVVWASASPVSAGAAGLSWSAPVTVDHQPPFAAPAFFTGISCPSAHLCAAVQGGILTSTHPRGDYRSWHAATITPRGASANPIGTTLAISCPSRALCVAVTSSGYAVTSRTPGSDRAWVATDIDDANPLSAISCPSTTLCVAVDQAGHALTTTDPTGPASAWHAAAIDLGHALVAVSCASASLCVALDSAGHVLTTSHPRGAASAWSSARIDSDDDAPTSVSCPSNSLCVAVDIAGDAITSTHPTGGASAWRSTNVMFAGANFIPGPVVSCVGTLCVIARQNEFVSTTHPTGPASDWSTVSLSSDQSFISGLSCPSARFCAAVDQTGGTPGFPIAYSGGEAITTTDPTGRDDRWRVRQVDGNNGVVNVSCASAPDCIAGNDAGDVLVAPRPFAWRLSHIDPNLSGGGPGTAGPPSERAVACFKTSGCVAGDDSGSVFATGAPAGGPSSWHALGRIGDYFEAFVSASCATATQCFMVSTSGDLAVIDPAATTTPHLVRIDPAQGLSSISCPSASLCAAVDFNGNVLTARHPAAGASSWNSAAIDPGNLLTGISCSSASLCVAVDSAGAVFTSTRPADGASAWTRAAVDPEHHLTGVSCPSASLCVAVDDAGHALTSTAPATGPWTSATIDPQRALTAVSCSPALECVAADSSGQVLVARRSNHGAAAARAGAAARRQLTRRR